MAVLILSLKGRRFANSVNSVALRDNSMHYKGANSRRSRWKTATGAMKKQAYCKINQCCPPLHRGREYMLPLPNNTLIVLYQRAATNGYCAMVLMVAQGGWGVCQEEDII